MVVVVVVRLFCEAAGGRRRERRRTRRRNDFFFFVSKFCISKRFELCLLFYIEQFWISLPFRSQAAAAAMGVEGGGAATSAEEEEEDGEEERSTAETTLLLLSSSSPPPPFFHSFSFSTFSPRKASGLSEFSATTSVDPSCRATASQSGRNPHSAGSDSTATEPAAIARFCVTTRRVSAARSSRKGSCSIPEPPSRRTSAASS